MSRIELAKVHARLEKWNLQELEYKIKNEDQLFICEVKAKATMITT